MESIERLAELAQEQLARDDANNPAIKAVLALVEDFLESHRCMCYGGTAINNLLPPEDRFYDPKIDIPDYDFFSETPQLHAMELADIIAKAGFKSVEVKPGMHLGTFKVFADYTGVADISFLEKPIFERLWEDSVVKDGIHYVPPNFLRMSVYLEISRPRGDVSRWKKVYSRIQLLNKNYPILCPVNAEKLSEEVLDDTIREKIERILVREKLVLLGFNASTIQEGKKQKWKLPLDVLSDKENHDELAEQFKSLFEGSTVKHLKEFGEILPACTDIQGKNGSTLIRIYETSACHSFHQLPSGMRVASIPTLLQFFLAMLYGNDDVRENIAEQRFICAAQHLVEMANDSGKRKYKILTPLDCIGHQDSMIDMKVRKANMYERVSKDKSSQAYLQYFFSYDPHKTSATKRKQLKDRLKKTLKRDPVRVKGSSVAT